MKITPETKAVVVLIQNAISTDGRPQVLVSPGVAMPLQLGHF